MEFRNHSDLKGMHAFLSGSSYYWTNYTDDKLRKVYLNHLAKNRGTELHELAEMAIRNRVKFSTAKKAINMFVNDAIGYNMQPEQTLYYSDNCFGTTDAILFKDNLLRIHDLKTGVSKVSFRQLYVYVAIFCLEYGYEPFDIDVELRIYQGNGYSIDIPDPIEIKDIMSRIVNFDIIIDQLKLESY